MKKSAFASGTSSRRYNAKAHGAFLFRTLNRTVEKDSQVAEPFWKPDLANYFGMLFTTTAHAGFSFRLIHPFSRDSVGL